MFLDRRERLQAVQRMKGCLANVIELQNKYIELGEFKKHSCQNINSVVPKIKVISQE